MTSTIKKALTIETLSGTTSASAYDGYYYADISTDTSNILSAIVASFAGNQSAFCQITGASQLRVWTKRASTAVSVKVVRG